MISIFFQILGTCIGSFVGYQLGMFYYDYYVRKKNKNFKKEEKTE